MNWLTLLHYFSAHPRRLFLLDGTGALLTAATLYGSYRYFDNCFQLPEDVFVMFFYTALYMAVFSFINVANPRNYKVFSLRFIGTANRLYALLTFSISLLYYKELAAIALFYFGVEMLILVLLSAVEFKVARILKTQASNIE
jgi:hypothetical protein